MPVSLVVPVDAVEQAHPVQQHGDGEHAEQVVLDARLVALGVPLAPRGEHVGRDRQQLEGDEHVIEVARRRHHHHAEHAAQQQHVVLALVVAALLERGLADQHHHVAGEQEQRLHHEREVVHDVAAVEQRSCPLVVHHRQGHDRDERAEQDDPGDRRRRPLLRLVDQQVGSEHDVDPDDEHEGANVIVGSSGHVAAYMGDDERFDYLYKFVSSNKYRRGTRPADRQRNKQLLTAGSLYVARFTGDSPAAQITGTGALPSDGAFDGRGQWLPIVVDGISQVPGFTTEQALTFTRLAADPLGATKMDRREDVEPNPRTGKVYVACTNNTSGASPARKVRPSRTRASATATGTSWRSPRAAVMPGRRRSSGTSCWCAVTPQRIPPPTSPGSPPTRCRRSPARTMSRSIRKTISGSPPTALPSSHRLQRRPVQGAPHRARTRPRAAVLVCARGMPKPAARSSRTRND